MPCQHQEDGKHNDNEQLIYGSKSEFLEANKKGADQSAQMGSLVSAFVVGNPPKTGFLATIEGP